MDVAGDLIGAVTEHDSDADDRISRVEQKLDAFLTTVGENMGRIGDTISTVSAPTRAAPDATSSGNAANRSQPWRRTISNVARRAGLVIAIFFAIASIVAASHLIALPSADAQRVDPNSPMLPSNVSYRHYVTTGTPVANVSACAYVNTTQCHASLHDQDTADNPADMQTKAVGPTKIAKHRRAIGVHEPNPSIPIVAVATRNPRMRMFQALADLKHAVARLK